MKTKNLIKKQIPFLGLMLLSVANLVNASEQSLTFEIPEGLLTLDAAFSMALENNPSIDEVEERVKSAEATIQRAKSYLYPTVNVNTGYNARSATMHPDWATSLRVSEDFNDFTAGLSLRWRIFDGLQDIHYIRAAKKGLESARFLHLDSQRVLLEQVSGVFIQSEMAKEQMRIAKSTYDFNRKQEQDAKTRFEVGELPEADVLNFSLALLVAETDYLNAKRDYDVSCSMLAQLLGLENGKLSADLYPLVEAESGMSGDDAYESLFAKAMRDRPDVQASLAVIASYGHQVDALKGSFLPKVELVSGINYTKTNDAGIVDQDENNTYAGVQVSWNVFSGGRRKAQVLEMQSSQNQYLHQYNQLTDYIASEIQQDLIKLTTSKEVLERQSVAESHARKIRDFVEHSYREGVVSVTRLNEAQTNWNKTASGLAVAKLQVLLNQYALESTTGSILSRTNGSISSQQDG